MNKLDKIIIIGVIICHFQVQNTVGQTTNLMAIDAEKLFLAIQFIHFIWQGPVTSIIVMLLLIREVGLLPAFSGMIFIFLLIPLQNYIGKELTYLLI